MVIAELKIVNYVSNVAGVEIGFEVIVIALDHVMEDVSVSTGCKDIKVKAFITSLSNAIKSRYLVKGQFVL